MKNILYINSWGYDYLADSFLIGLKQCADYIVYELPANQFVYGQSNQNAEAIHGKGFTLCNVLRKDTQKIFTEEISLTSVDIFVFSAIHRQFGLYLQLLPFLKKTNTIILDGEDYSAVFPYSGTIWRKPYLWFMPRPHKRFLYFKRELIPAKVNRYFYLKLVPEMLCRLIPLRSAIREISFSIPTEKVVTALPEKQKLFPLHIVDTEVADRVEGSYVKYAFDKEQDYYADLQASRFGITTKRAGWDCMRHYEIAANGAVICFRELDKKPKRCAPHGLVDGVNCLSYVNYDDLMKKINALSESRYDSLQKNSISWVKEHTCDKVAARTLLVLSNKV